MGDLAQGQMTSSRSVQISAVNRLYVVCRAVHFGAAILRDCFRRPPNDISTFAVSQFSTIKVCFQFLRERKQRWMQFSSSLLLFSAMGPPLSPFICNFF